MNVVKRKKFYRQSDHMTGGLVDLLLTLPLWMREYDAIEIGSFIGESASILSLFFKNVICIDPHSQDDTFSGYKKDDIRRLFAEKTAGRNIRIVERPSADVFDLFPDKRFSFVYIDGGHDYNSVSQDVRNYYSKIVDDGFIGGHDYGSTDPLCAGVKQAVDEAFGEPKYLFEDSSWLIQKNKDL
jgi:predicted O-methyltransferase YrrM